MDPADFPLDRPDTRAGSGHLPSQFWRWLRRNTLGPLSTKRAQFGLRIFNPDGSEAEKSGNGLRIFSRTSTTRKGRTAPFTVDTPGGVVEVTIQPGGQSSPLTWVA